jgi:hypothetical protein
MTFEEIEHRYEKNGIEYTSVGNFLDKFRPPFEKELIAGMVAKKTGKEPNEVISMWDLNSQISTNYGTSLHKGIEYWIKFGEISKLPHIKETTEKFAEKFKDKKLKSEIVAFDDEHRIAGTIDVLEMLGNKKVNIIDIKTNYEINKKKQGYFLSPIADIPNTKVNGYRLQLSLYKYLVEKHGFIVEEIQLEHWDGKEYNTIKLEPINVENLLLHTKIWN